MKKKMCHWCGQDNNEDISECEYCGENLINEANYDLIDVENEDKITEEIRLRKIQKERGGQFVIINE